MPLPSRDYRDLAAAALAPFFSSVTPDEIGLAREAARTTLDEYSPATPGEWQLAAQIVAYGLASLACLGAAMGAKGLPIEDMLKLREAAIALDRFSQKCTKALETGQRERLGNPDVVQANSMRWDTAGFDAAMNKALRKMRLAEGKLSSLAKPTPQANHPTLKILSGKPMTSAVLATLATNAKLLPQGPQGH